MLGKSLGVKDTSERSHWGREVKELERGGAEVMYVGVKFKVRELRAILPEISLVNLD